MSLKKASLLQFTQVNEKDKEEQSKIYEPGRYHRPSKNQAGHWNFKNMQEVQVSFWAEWTEESSKDYGVLLFEKRLWNKSFDE